MTIHPTRDDSDLSCGELVTPNNPQHAVGWERGCVCWQGGGGGSGRRGVKREGKGRKEEGREGREIQGDHKL